MENNMYDKNGFLKPEYTLTESEKRAMLFNNDIKIINLRTDFGKGISFKSVDGHEYASMEAAEAANKAFFNRMIIDKPLEDYTHYTEIEKAYFDCITPKPNDNNMDKDIILQALATQPQRIINYIEKRYLSYISEVLKQYGYNQQDSNKKTKK